MTLTPRQRNYRDYLRTPHWQQLRARIVARAHQHCEWCDRFCGPNPHWPFEDCGDEDCEWCVTYFDEDGRNDREQQTLEVHHQTYERLGAERDEDLVALCWSCHEEVTERALLLRSLYRQGLIPRSANTPRVAATKWWDTGARRAGPEAMTTFEQEDVQPVCPTCQNSGWERLVCVGDRECGRRRRHRRHEYVRPCPCRPINRAYQERQERSRRIAC